MTDTTTTDRVDEENLVDAAAEAAEALKAKSLATMRPEQQRWDENQLAILRALGIEDASQGDLDLFFHYCRTTGLDPFKREIYMIGRNTKITEWKPRNPNNPDGPKDRHDKWVVKYTIQTGIDGYRKNGREAAKRYGDDLDFDGPWYTGENDFHVTDDGEVIQHWRKVWPKGKPPHAARFIVYRNGKTYEGIAHYDEFVQTAGSNGDPNSMWTKMPRNQIGKCAEALAYRRAYPDDFAGLILEDSSQPTVIDPEGNVEKQGGAQQQRAGGRGVGGLRDRARAAQKQQQQPEVIDVEEVDPEAPEVTQQHETRVGDGDTSEVETEVENTTADPGAGGESDLRKQVRQKLNADIAAEFRVVDLLGDDAAADRLVVIRAILGDPNAVVAELTDEQLQKLRNDLVGRREKATLADDIREWINAEDLRQQGVDADGGAK